MTEQVESLALRMAKLWVMSEMDPNARRELDKIADELIDRESADSQSTD